MMCQEEAAMPGEHKFVLRHIEALRKVAVPSQTKLSAGQEKEF